MKDDEIKEKKTKRIIEKIEGLATYVTIPRELAIYNVNIDSQEAKLLIDYITNLQQKVEYYEGFEINKTIDKIRLQNNREYKEVMTQLEDYKSRCEKANELTNNLLNTENSGYYKIIFQKQLDTLNGRNDE